MTKTDSGPPRIAGLTPVRLLSSSGGYGDVYLYREEGLGREVAVKVLREKAVDPVARQRFETEAMTMARLQHPNVVAIHAIGVTSDQRAYIVMAYCPERTLGERAIGGTLPVAEALRVGVEIGGALETAHRAGIIHRDVKPANILTLPWGAPGLTDFGVAAQMTPADDQVEDDVGVSIPWSPPEMLFTETRGDATTDVYSLAATVWHLLVGRSPFEVPGRDNSRIALMGRIRDLAPPPTGRADVPPSLESALARGMAKQAGRRFPSADAFAKALIAVERELHLAPTRVVVTTGSPLESSPALGAPPRDVDDRTRVRAPQSVPPAPTSPSTSRSGGVQRSASLGVERPSTGRSEARSSSARRQVGRLEPTTGPGRGVAGSPGRAAAPVDHPSTDRARGALLAGGLVTALVAGAVAYAVWSRGDEPHVPSGTVTEGTVPADPGNGVGQLPPGPVTVTGAGSAAEITFTWDYSALLASDTYRWRTNDDRSGRAADPELTLDNPTGKKLCLEVIVVRQDGSSATRTYSDPGCFP